MRSRAARLWALLCLALALQLAAARSFQVVGRQDDGSKDAPAPPSSRSTASNTGDNNKPVETPAPRTSATQGDDQQRTASVTEGPTATPHTTASSSTAPTATTSFDSSKFFNATIPDGELPLTPELTPGWGVAGAIMLTTGPVYALVGIKNRWIHTFFSTAYMTALGVSVLIVYVMEVPVSDATQGGYVVAAVLSGCAVGGVSMYFKELTEFLGCALGGFCLSMWLLCLTPGGLLRPTASKAIFVACFTLFALGFYFSRWTRDWALILTIAFSGSTITVLGIDCFSRAGLKEFWAYVWNVNSSLFPLGADTFPITKGIRVETAAIIIFFLVGIVSQIKLWRIVREKRERRAAARAEDLRELQLEEEGVGRQVEEANARERRHWERVYGDKSIADSSGTSDSGDIGSEKRATRSDAEAIEMANMSDSEHSRNGPQALMAAGDAQEGNVTVRVAADDVPQTTAEGTDETEGMAADVDEAPTSPTGDRRLSQMTTTAKRVSQAQTVTEAPAVVPLPFTVPPNEDAKSVGDRSSIATFADDVEAATPARPRHSLVKRLSQSSATLLRSFSQRSGRGGDDLALENGESREELVVPTSHRHDADNGSLAATVDGESISGADRHSVRSVDPPRTIEINAELGKEEPEVPAEQSHEALPVEALPEPPETARSTEVKPTEVKPTEVKSTEAKSTEAKSTEARSTEAKSTEAKPTEAKSTEARSTVAKSTVAKSTTSVASSVPVSLTKDRLPQSLSRVAMSYRTNEWAKHLSYADTPEPVDVHVDEAAPAVNEAPVKERPAPVNVEDLQKTAEDGTPAPAIRRSESQMSRSESRMSNASPAPGNGRRLSKRDTLSSLVIPKKVPQDREQSRSPVSPPSTSPGRAASAAAMRRTSSGFKPIAEEHPPAAPASDTVPAEKTVMETASSTPSTGSEAPPRPIPGVVSYASPQTLIGQREMFLRSKSQGTLLSTTPEPAFAPQGPSSDAGSVYNYPAYSSVLNVSDPDDLPLTQRRELIRQSSVMSLSQRSNGSGMRAPSLGAGPRESSENLAFNSHQPKRASTLPAQAVRDAQLANFRQSVQQELRAGSPMVTPSGRESLFTTSSLLGNREAEIQRNIDMQRNVLMGQKEAEAQRREAQRREKELLDRAFDERMRSGDLLEAHREAMRKMQNGSRRG